MGRAVRKEDGEGGPASVIRIPPLHYVHVTDSNRNVTRVVTGPATFTRQDHEVVVKGPEAMVRVPPQHYCIVDNPAVCDAGGAVQTDRSGNVRLRHGDQELRFNGPPFALQPGEALSGTVTPLLVVAADSALLLQCVRDFGAGGDARRAGDQWLWRGPGTYVPRIEVVVRAVRAAEVVGPHEALWLRAAAALPHRGLAAGAEWLERAPGAYLPDVHEEVVRRVAAVVLGERAALHLRAKRTYVDVFGTERKAGQQWLVTGQDAAAYVPDVYEEVVGKREAVSLRAGQFAVVADPVDRATKLPRRGGRVLVRGPALFFLQPGESLEGGAVQDEPVLAPTEALLLTAVEAVADADGVARAAGDRWLVHGPGRVAPQLGVTVLERRQTLLLDVARGLYVRHLATGHVRVQRGGAYLLTADEELWAKSLPDRVEELLAERRGGGGARDPTRLVTLRAPHNTAVQVYDYRLKAARVVFGPALVELGPEEHFTLLSLSGGTPKRAHVVKDVCLQLGPSFTTDVVTVDTADHARLQLKLAYNWRFDADGAMRSGRRDAAALFQVPDFVGDFCQALAARVRGAVAQVSFDAFHRHSADLIRAAIFGRDAASGKIQKERTFVANGLTVFNVDIQSVEPVDPRTRDSLLKSVQLAIDITTRSQEAEARHRAANEEQAARGQLQRQKISDDAAAESARSDLLELRNKCRDIEATGHAHAEAHARAAAARIRTEALRSLAEHQAQALTLRTSAELAATSLLLDEDIRFRAARNALELRRAEELAEIAATKFDAVVAAIGPDTMRHIALAGPKLQAELLEGLGLQSFLITDGKSPVNLFNTANGLVPSAAAADE